jgi:hypothetical protein
VLRYLRRLEPRARRAVEWIGAAQGLIGASSPDGVGSGWEPLIAGIPPV